MYCNSDVDSFWIRWSPHFRFCSLFAPQNSMQTFEFLFFAFSSHLHFPFSQSSAIFHTRPLFFTLSSLFGVIWIHVRFLSVINNWFDEYSWDRGDIFIHFHLNCEANKTPFASLPIRIDSGLDLFIIFVSLDVVIRCSFVFAQTYNASLRIKFTAPRKKKHTHTIFCDTRQLKWTKRVFR